MDIRPKTETFVGKNLTTLVDALRSIVGEQFVLFEKEDVVVYEQDGSIFQVMPEIVVVPDTW